MLNQRSEQRHPFTSLLLLLFLALIGAVVFTFLSMVAGYFIFKPESIVNMSQGITNVGFQKLVLAFSSVGMFIFPALFFSYNERKNGSKYIELERLPKVALVFLSMAIMFFATPFIEWTVLLNEQMKLPPFLKELEIWMRNKEDELAEMTKALLVMKTIPALLVNLLIVAVIPAIGEEFTFRGCVQRIFSRWTSNYHLGIWIAAIIFSTIHFQFYGFIPRMLLGALFGYMFVWTKSIWVPVAAHFYNNATAVIGAYSLQKQGKSLDEFSQAQTFEWHFVILSVVISALLLWVMWRGSDNQFNSKRNDKRLD